MQSTQLFLSLDDLKTAVKLVQVEQRQSKVYYTSVYVPLTVSTVPESVLPHISFYRSTTINGTVIVVFHVAFTSAHLCIIYVCVNFLKASTPHFCYY